MNRRVARCLVRFVFAVASAVAVGECGLPQVPDGFNIELVASEPLVRNPCAMAFDSRGRMWIGMGPQYRNPKPDTPGDSVFLLRDTDADGNYDKRQVFATGLNSIQGLAWHGRDLWIANSPDLTVVRDEDGDGGGKTKGRLTKIAVYTLNVQDEKSLFNDQQTQALQL